MVERLHVGPRPMAQRLSTETRWLDRWWRAANFLACAQIFLQDNVLLREPLRPEHIKPRLLGHWGTSPGLNLLYAHLLRATRVHALQPLFVAGPGHGARAVLANVWLEGSYCAVRPELTRDAVGMHRLCREFSTPGGVPSHVGAHVPGSMHEGGELGYGLLHAYGPVFDNPDLLALAVVGDGEAETGPASGAWKSLHFINPARDGAVLPVLHLNGYREEGTTTTPFDMVVLNRISRYHLAERALDLARRDDAEAAALRAHCRRQLAEHALCIRTRFEDLPEVRDWRWSDTRSPDAHRTTETSR